VREIDAAYGKPEFLLFDEIQNLPRWELFANRLQRQGRKLVITGSNSNLLSQELATHLTGRHLPVPMLPFSFREAMLSWGAAEGEAAARIGEYLQKGGYPEVCSGGIAPRDYLPTLFDAVLFKDVVKRHRIRAPQRMEDLALWLLSNPACELTYDSLAKSARMGSPLTAEKYLRHLEEAFLFFSVPRFSHKAAERISSARKAYCIDTGFAAARGALPSPDRGKICENAVAIELFREQLSGGCELFHWKNPQKHEVDFAVRRNLRIAELVQVCYDPSGKAREREVRALLRAGRELSCGSLTVVTHDYEAEEKESWFGMQGTVRYVPLWKWLLSRGREEGGKQ
jgi:predicted AAA+ superfamily ATPase